MAHGREVVGVLEALCDLAIEGKFAQVYPPRPTTYPLTCQPLNPSTPLTPLSTAF